jgi:hypothetical protein
MKLKSILSALATLVALNGTAQIHDNDYRSSANKYYWQNRLPDKAYWQQDVHYKI